MDAVECDEMKDVRNSTKRVKVRIDDVRGRPGETDKQANHIE